MKLNLLVAFPYFTDKVRAIFEARNPESFRLMLDSGAFSAWKSGGAIDIEDYMRVIKSLPAAWEVDAIQLDAMGQPKATKTNFLRMQAEGCKVMPVLTRGAPIEDRDWFYEHADYLCLGGIVKSPEYLSYLRMLMETNEGRRVHWLGYTRMPDVKRYRPTSVDSSNHSRGERWGFLAYYDKGGRMRTLRKPQFVERPPERFFDACRRIGWRPMELRALGYAEAWKGGVREPGPDKRGFAAYVTTTHHIAHAVDVERNIGTRVYTAMASANQIAAAFSSWDFLHERRFIEAAA